MHILRSLKRSPLGLDLYVWLVYRTFTLRAPLCLSWRQVLRQFGADPAKESRKNSVQNFRRQCLREIKKLNARGQTCPITRSRAGSLSSPVRLASRPLLSSVSSGTGSRSRQLVERRVERTGPGSPAGHNCQSKPQRKAPVTRRGAAKRNTTQPLTGAAKARPGLKRGAGAPTLCRGATFGRGWMGGVRRAVAAPVTSERAAGGFPQKGC